MVQLNELKTVVLLIALIALIAGASALALDEFQDTTITDTAGCNSTDTSSCGYDYNITQDGLVGVDNTTSFLGTIGTIFGVMVLVGVVVTAFNFSRR